MKKLSPKEQILAKVNFSSTPPRGACLVLAVSGGVDSMSLLYLLSEMAQKYDWQIVVAHLNHLLRGRAARMDALLVDKEARALGWPQVLEEVDVGGYAEKSKKGLEEAGRELRYRFLNRVKDKYRADYLVTAHTADDQVETILMNFLRGAALKGMGGMAVLEGNIWRPLLSVSKEELLAYAKENKIPFREDITNKDLGFTRNRIRRQLIPQLLKFNPHFKEVILNNAPLFRQVASYLRQQASLNLFRTVKTKAKEEIIFDRKKFLRLPRILQAEILKLAVSELGDLSSFRNTHFEEMLNLVSGKEEGSKRLPSKLWLKTSYDKITLSLHP